MENQIQLAPIVHPTAKEFANFQEYVYTIENRYSKNYGMVKVVPPKTWKPRKSSYEEVVQNDYIPQPIEQNAQGKGGIYECLHIVQKSLSMKDYKKRNQVFDHFTDGKSMEKIEELFYKNISFSPPVYGADARNTLFEDNCKQWNLNNLNCLLTEGIEGKISGVNDPYLYVGAWKTLFPWHKEDLDLAAVNYLHHGKPKFWYAVPEEDQHYLEKMAKLSFADNFNKCSEFMRHKTVVINPYLVKKQFPQCRINKMIQKEREFIIVFGGAYHHGFNYGFNIAEAVNFATKNWLNSFAKAKVCKCLKDNVKINHREFYENLIQQNPSYKNEPEIKTFLKEIKARGLYDNIEYDEKIQLSEQDKKTVNQELEKQKQKPLPLIKKKIEKKQKQRQEIKEEQQQQEADDSLSQNSSSTTVPTQKKKPQKPQRKRKSSVTQYTNRKQSNSISENQPQSVDADSMIIEDWLQCDSCKKWRKIDYSLKNLKRRKQFYCNSLNINCSSPQNEMTFAKGTI